jgi:hypothetical protein
MKSHDDILMRLRALAEEDREWILTRLSPDAKSRLVAGAAPSTSVDEPDQNSPRRLLAEAYVPHVCQALRTEPAWVLAGILKAHPWPWHAILLASLPVSTRLEVQRLASASYTAQMLDSILRLAQQKVANCSEPPSDSRFAKLVAKLSAARVRRRSFVQP